MNAERLHVILKAFQAEVNQSNSKKLSTSLVKHVDQSVQQPNQSQPQTGIANTLKSLEDAASASPSLDFPPAWIQTMDELGINQFLSPQLYATFRAILDRNEITPAVAQAEFTEINNQFDEAMRATNEAVAAFEKFGIGEELLGSDHALLDALVPRTAVSNNLRDLGRELQKLHNMFGAFQELATGKRDGFQIKTISSSDFGIGIDLSDPGTIACILYSIDKLVDFYKKLVEIQVGHKQLSEHVPEEVLEPLKEHSEKVISQEIEKLIPKLEEKFKSDEIEEGRMNELRNDLSISLKGISSRIDSGFHFEVRMLPIGEPAEDAQDDENEDRADLAEVREMLRASKDNMGYIRSPGPPILPGQISEEEENNSDT